MTSAFHSSLPHLGVLEATGEDARVFLHGQLSNDVEHLPQNRARLAAYCSAKGRMLADFLVAPASDGFLLVVARELAAPMQKRLGMFVLRSKVKIRDASADRLAFGVWGAGAQEVLARLGFAPLAGDFDAATCEAGLAVRMAQDRFLLLGALGLEAKLAPLCAVGEAAQWHLGEIRAGVARITPATQDQFVPQMANLELIGGIDFKKGCYPGQEIVARTQYLGKLKRRMYRAEVDASTPPTPGQDVYGLESGAPAVVGSIVNAAQSTPGRYEVLAVLQTSAAMPDADLRLSAADGPKMRVTDLPYRIPASE